MKKTLLAGRVTARLAVLALLLSFCGCVPALVAGAGAGVGYSFSQIAYRTFKADVSEVDSATHKTLADMGFTINGSRPNEKGKEVYASAAELSLVIVLERITPMTTKVSVNAKKKFLLKDKATAERILDEMSKILDKK